ncbi:hypothetical protein QFZ28_002447 [Neobacillus niacini]|nr:hypothetical protein [Neobacillus niacini]
MAKKCYLSFIIISVCMALLLMSSCSQLQRKEESNKNKTPREVLGFYTEQEGNVPRVATYSELAIRQFEHYCTLLV